MKKIIAIVFSSLFMFSLASAEMGVNVGLSGSMGAFAVTGTEQENDETNKEDAVGAASWGSVFVELRAGDRVTIGVDYLPAALESESTETVVDDQKSKTDGASAKATNKVSVEFENLTTAYVALNVTDTMYVKGGIMQVDVMTEENLGTGSKYGNTDLDGMMLGVGYHADMGDFFVRVEGTYMDFDDASLVSSTNSDNKISITDLNGVSAKLSVGKSF